jgi:hypothetical protein
MRGRLPSKPNANDLISILFDYVALRTILEQLHEAEPERLRVHIAVLQLE